VVGVDSQDGECTFEAGGWYGDCPGGVRRAARGWGPLLCPRAPCVRVGATAPARVAGAARARP